MLPVRQRVASRLASFGVLVAALALPALAALPAGCSRAEAAPTTMVVGVDGMHCDGCVRAITDKVLKVKGVSSCDVSLEEGRATVTTTEAGSLSEIESAITRLGYTIRRGGAPARPAPSDAEGNAPAEPSAAPAAGPTEGSGAAS